MIFIEYWIETAPISIGAYFFYPLMQLCVFSSCLNVRFFIGYWIKNGLDFYPALSFVSLLADRCEQPFFPPILFPFYMSGFNPFFAPTSMGSGFHGIDLNQVVYSCHKNLFRCNHFYLFQRLIFEFS